MKCLLIVSQGLPGVTLRCLDTDSRSEVLLGFPALLSSISKCHKFSSKIKMLAISWTWHALAPLSFSGTSSHPPSLRGSFLLFVPFKTRIINFSSPGSLLSSSQVDSVFLLRVCRKHFCLSHPLPNWVVIFLFNGPPPPLHSGPLETGAKSYFSWFPYCLTAMPSTH